MCVVRDSRQPKPEKTENNLALGGTSVGMSQEVDK